MRPTFRHRAIHNGLHVAKRVLGIAVVSGCAHLNAQTPGATASLVAAERAFAADAAARTVDQAFHSAFHEQGILFRPTPVNAHPALGNKPIPATLDLKWGPIYAETSADGTLGYTTGYATVGQRGAAPDGTSWFVSVWKKTDAGWKVMTDGGIDAETLGSLDKLPSLLTTKANTKSFSGGPEMIDVERHLITNYTTLFPTHAAGDVRVMRDGSVPKPGNGALIKNDAATEFEPKRWEVASSGDLGFVYGITNPKSEKPRSYERIYRRNLKGDWEIVVDWRN